MLAEEWRTDAAKRVVGRLPGVSEPEGKLETRPEPPEMDVALKAAFSLQPGRQMPAPVAETRLEGASGKLWPQVDRE